MCIDFIHASEVFDVLHKDSGLHHVCHAQLLSFEHCFHVLQGTSGLLHDISFDKLPCGRIKSYLTRKEKQVPRTNGLRIRSNRLGCLVRVNRPLLHGLASLWFGEFLSFDL
jgi:hypothetical protein